MCYSRYGCVAHMIKDRNCQAASIHVDSLNEYIEKRILALSNEIKTQQNEPKDSIKIRKKIQSKRDEIKELEEKTSMLLELYLTKGIERETYIKKNDELTTSVAKALKEIEKLNEPLLVKQTLEDDYIETLEERWLSANLAGKREILQKLISKIIIGENTVKICWLFE